MPRKPKPLPAEIPVKYERRESGHCFYCRGALTAIQPGGGKPWLHEDGTPYGECYAAKPAKTEAA